MITIITICSRTPLDGKNSKSYNGLAFDGQQYYVTNKLNNEIAVLDTNFEVIEYIEPSRPYTALCYDEKEKCFWAASGQNERLLFKLDCQFKELAQIELVFDCKCSGLISGVSYCSKSDQLVISTQDCLALVEKHSSSTKVIQKEGRASVFRGALCAAPYYMYITNNKSSYYLGLVSYNKKMKEKGCVALGCPVTSALLYPHQDQQGFYHVYFLAHKHRGGAYILDARLSKRLSDLLCNGGEKSCRPCEQEPDLRENEYSNVQNFYRVFGYKQEREKYPLKNNSKHETDTCKPCRQNNDCAGQEENCCCIEDCCPPCCGCECTQHCCCETDCCNRGGYQCAENEWGCCPPCCGCECTDNCCCETCCCTPCYQACGGPCWENGCNRILESIALQEEALAQILRIESEKLQKAVSEDAGVCGLLEVNESVCKTVVHVTQLEQALYAKVEALGKICKCFETSSYPQTASTPETCDPVYPEKEGTDGASCEADGAAEQS